MDEAPPLEPGCGIEISTTLIKRPDARVVGCEVYADGALVARARHARFLKIDPLHDLLVHSPLHNARFLLSRYYAGLEPHPCAGDTSLDAIFKPRRIQENAFEVDVTRTTATASAGSTAARPASWRSTPRVMVAEGDASLMRGLESGRRRSSFSRSGARLDRGRDRRGLQRGDGLAGELTSRRWRGTRP